MNSTSIAYRAVLSWVVTLLVPLALVLAAVRVLLTPAFVNFEYRTPGFPADPFGFTLDERLHYSLTSLDYLLNDADVSFLGRLRFPEGQTTPQPSCQFMDDCTRLFNDRELQHMLDVKHVVQASLRGWYISLAGLLALGIWARAGGWWHTYLSGLARGGWATVGLIGLIIVLVFLAFDVFFVTFHRVFFSEGTWMFLYSDTLIRLFPERFWRDTFIAVGILASGVGILSSYLSSRFLR